MGLLSRLRVRLGGAPPAPAGIGTTFTPAMAEVWTELEEQVDGELKKAGASVVGAWEVGAAELGRVGSSRVDLQACKLEYSIVSPK